MTYKAANKKNKIATSLMRSNLFLLLLFPFSQYVHASNNDTANIQVPSTQLLVSCAKENNEIESGSDTDDCMKDDDKDGIANISDNCPSTENPGQWDRDQDGIGNECDSDIDGDGYSNEIEQQQGTKIWDVNSFPLTLNSIDNDEDGVIDSQDNCIDIANTGQWDRDKDGIGNECDDDIDGDGYSNQDEVEAGTKAWSAEPPYPVLKPENIELIDEYDDAIATDNVDNCLRIYKSSQNDSNGGDHADNCISLTGTNDEGPVSYYGQLQVKGKHIVAEKSDQSIQVKGLSLFWSNRGFEHEKYWNDKTISHLVDKWHIEVIRAAMGTDLPGGLFEDETNKDRLEHVIEAAIANDIYVIIDWQSHQAENYTLESKAFFEEMAIKYGHYDHVIFEIYSEPTDETSAHVIQDYAHEIIPLIRAHSDNLIIVGTSSWSQDVNDVKNAPIKANNIAYALHPLAGLHGQNLLDKAEQALSDGIAIFVSQWSYRDHSGTGSLNIKQWNKWLDKHSLSSAFWAISDKEIEHHSLFNADGGVSVLGEQIKKIQLEHVKKTQWFRDKTGYSDIKQKIAEVAVVDGYLVAGKDMEKPDFSLYVFDDDLNVKGSACSESCSVHWPPLLVEDGDVGDGDGLSTIVRHDGSIQATFHGRPLYYFAGDSSAGQQNGNGIGRLWWSAKQIPSN